MTEQEKNHICAGLLIFATATERLMYEYQKINRVKFHGKTKQMYNAMVRNINAAKHYYSQFVDQVSVELAISDKNFLRVDDMRDDADFMIRLFMNVINCNAHKFSNADIEEGLQKLIKKIEKKDNQPQEISDEVINMFHLITK